MEFNRIIIYCDYGLDDAIATLHILEHSHMFRHIDVVPIGGNVPVITAYRNAHSLLAAAAELGLSDKTKTRLIDTRAVPQPKANIPDIHGTDGIGDVLDHKPCDIPVVSIDEFARGLKAEKQPERDCVLSLGPCTVPVLVGYVPFCTTLMGGTTNEPPNYGKYEFNEALDPDAFKTYAYSASAVATLDTCHSGKFDFYALAENALSKKLTERGFALDAARGALPVVYDLVAALAVTRPQDFDVVRVRRTDGVEYNELLFK